MRKILCFFGKHDYKLIGRDLSYNTHYVGIDFEKKWIVEFFECSCCKKRKFKSNHSGYHRGIEIAKSDWLEREILSSGCQVFDEEPKKSATLHVFPGGKTSA